MLLSRHPDFPCTAAASIQAGAARTDGRLILRYAVEGGPGLFIPPPADPVRTDGLWRHTCFEAFVRAPGAPAYFEFNLAPSGQWAAYSFTGYREGMAPLAIPPPAMTWRATDNGHELTAEVDLSPVPELGDGPWDVALTTVIEETDGRTSYWALAHPPGKPDFHSPDGFALSLPGPS
jgi:hypothetical protein